MVHGDTSQDDSSASSTFQQELKVHLLVIQRKLDDLGRRIDASHAATLAGPGRKVPIAQAAGEDIGRSIQQSSLAATTREAQQGVDRRMSLLRPFDPRPPAAAPRPDATMDGDLEVISLTHALPGEANADSKEGTTGEPKSAPEPGGRIVGVTSLMAPEIARYETEYGSIVPTPKDSPAQVPVLKAQGTRGSSSDTVPSEAQQEQHGQQQRRSSQGSSIMSEDGLRLRGVVNWLRSERIPGQASRVMEQIGVKRMVGNAREQISIRSSGVQQRGVFRFVHGVPFNLLGSFMIGLNVIMLGVSANARLQCELSKTPESPAWEYIEAGFVVFFTVEVVLRMFADRILFLFGHEWKWNVFDLVLVLSSILDLFLSKFTNAALSDVTMARGLRFVRFVRIIRIARAVRAFHSLRIVVFAIIESVMQLIWCLLVVGVIIYIFALLFLLGLTEHVSSPAWDSNDQAAALLENYGSVPTAILTLFMTISGGVDWRDVMRPLESIHWIYQPVFTFYVFLMVIGVLNVVMGAFVAATAEITNKDREALIKNEIVQFQAYSNNIKAFFQDADTDGSGLLSWEEFQEHLKVPKVAAYFRSLELDMTQAHVLFKLLDRDGNGEVSLDEFLAGCLRLKGQAKSLEVNMLLYENKRLFTKISDFMEVMGEQLPSPVTAAATRRSRRVSTRFSVLSA